MSLLVLSLCALLQGAPEELDVVHLKAGGTRSGRVVSETSSELVLETFLKGPKGQIVGSAKVAIPREQIDRVERASAEARKRSEERSAAFADRAARRAELIAKFEPRPAAFGGFTGVETTGTHFRMQSTCDPAFVRELSASLEELFLAYRRFFEVRRNAEKKIRVFVLNDALEFQRFSIRRFGGGADAVGFFSPADNAIVVYNLIQKQEERMVRLELNQAGADLERYRTKLVDVERKIDGIVSELRRRIAAEANDLRRQARQDGGPGREERVREIDQAEREALAELRDGKAAAQKELQAERKAAADAMAACRRTIDANQRVLEGQNRLMFETLFHEAFHAFAANYLWEGSGEKEFPRWLHEGMACYFEMSVVENGALVHGAAHPALLALLREKQALRTILPVEKILRGGAEIFVLSHPKEADRRTTYYAQSWLLAHYLSTRMSPAEVAAYVTDVLGGADRVAAFEKRLGRTCAQLDAELQKHLEAMR